MQQTDYDIVIIGGGLVGASLACALSQLPLRIAVVEAWPLGADEQPGFDERTLALSYGSRRIFEGLGLWQDIEQTDCTPIKRIHVSDRGHPGMTRLDCREQQLEALGYVVPSRVVGKVLTHAIGQQAAISLHSPARLLAMEVQAGQVELNLDENGTSRALTTRLVVGADGIHSSVRELAGIGSRQLDYGQTAVIANIGVSRFHDYTAYERFTDSGPLAILPASTAAEPAPWRCAVVWTVDSDQADAVMALDDASFKQRLTDMFGQRLGDIVQTGQRSAFPLSLRHAREHVRPRLALIGNAAHTLHPIAGQGFNLGLRDVASLAQVLSDAMEAAEDPGSLTVLKRYLGWRRRDHLRVISFTDGLVRLFSNNFIPLVLARNLGLATAELLPPLRHLLTRRAMGMTGQLPRLARGLPLQERY
jgi:2-octaprenyl-6-methoxyphenol hydroxylase